MKKINYLINGFMLLFVVGCLAQCTAEKAVKSNDESTATASKLTGIKIAYVEIDTLLAKYNFCIDLNEAMVKKSENVRLQLNEKANELDKEKREFQKKYENNAFLSKESAESQYSRLAKKEQDLQKLSNKLQQELMRENEKNSIMFRDSINAFLKDYNAVHGYNLILSNTGFDNLLYADKSFNITDEVIEGLNSRYSGKKK